MTLPTIINLRRVPVGSVMASSPPLQSNVGNSIRCWGDGPHYESTQNERGVLAEGFSDVYQTGIVGIGVRFFDLRGYRIIPNGYSWVGSALVAGTVDRIRIDYIRISRDVATGTAKIDSIFKQNFSSVNMLEMKFIGETKFETDHYFSGCAGIEKINVSMGRVLIPNFQEKQSLFNLDVLCTGMPSGAKVPVKVYFEGNSDGPGRLSLEPGGAQGVEISLLNDRGVGLPFSKGSALSMTWIRSEPKGEIYRLPVVAAYAKKGSQKIEVGKANATLNYVLEYN